MGIYYGDIHYGVRISRPVSLDGGLLEPIYGLIFSSQSDLEKVRDFYKTLTKPNDYRYFVCVDVYTTFNGIQGIKEWQPITEEQMEKFVNGAYEIGFLCDKN
jgi:hypothetical protein